MTSMLHPTAPPRPHAAELGEADRLLLWAFRSWIRGVAEARSCAWSAVWNLFAVRLGADDGKVAVADISAMVRRLGDHARRPFVYHQPACTCLGSDEAGLLEICVVAAGGGEGRAETLARRFLGDAAAADFARRGGRLARLLARHGLALSDANTVAAVPVGEQMSIARPAAATLH